jgi:acyl carrier protein
MVEKCVNEGVLSMSVDAITARLLTYVVANVLESDPSVLKPDTPLADSGIFDSFSALMFANFLEEEFGVTVEVEQLNGKDFASIQTIARWVARSTSAN